jgi:hypothetical protein
VTTLFTDKCGQLMFILLLLFRRSGANIFALLFHAIFEISAGFCPHIAGERHSTAPFCFAIVRAGDFAAAALAFAIVLLCTAVLHCSARTLAGASIFAVGALAFAGIQAAANVEVCSGVSFFCGCGTAEPGSGCQPGQGCRS